MSTTLNEDFERLATSAERASQVAILSHRAGSAVYDRLNKASRLTSLIRPRFRPRVPLLLGFALAIWRFFVGKLTLHHLFILDVVVPRSGEGSPLDQLVRQLGFEIDDNRQLRGSRFQMAKRLALTVFAGLLMPLLRLLPEVREWPLLQDIPLLQWLSSLSVDPLALGLVGVAIGSVLFVFLEWRINLFGLLRPQPDVSTSEAEITFIAEQVRERQRRGFPPSSCLCCSSSGPSFFSCTWPFSSRPWCVPGAADCLLPRAGTSSGCWPTWSSSTPSCWALASTATPPATPSGEDWPPSTSGAGCCWARSPSWASALPVRSASS
jgi:hypothetical protein